MPEDDPEGDPTGDQTGDPAGDPKEGDDPKGGDPKGGKQKGSGPKGGIKPEDFKKLQEDFAAASEMLKKQNSIIEQLTGLGGDPPKAKTDAERIIELENSTSLLMKKIKTEEDAKIAQLKKEHEDRVDRFIEEQPIYKDDRDKLLKSNGDMLDLLSKSNPHKTTDPQVRTETAKNDWNKKIAAATQRKLEQQKARSALTLNKR